jgi:hypothetical protein
MPERILKVADCLQHRWRLGIAVPMRTQPAQARKLKPSQLNRDLRTKLSRCTAVLFIYREGPAHQVDQQIDVCQQAATEPRDDEPAPTLDLCHTGSAPLTYVPPELTVHPSSGEADCVYRFVAALRAPLTP